ncbi:MAG: YcaO-like family protein [Thermodesulfobacterium sp.]|nr:YcaO-like family protein [Thermodesulfobacterium sp.]
MLKTCLKKYTYAQEKACFPSETVEKALKKLYSTEKSILKEISRIDNLDRIGVPVYMCKVDKEIAKSLGVGDTFGKGITSEQAKASALMELVERYSNFSFLLSNHFLIDFYENLKDKAISIENLLLSLSDVFREERFIERLKKIPLKWTEAYDFIERRKILFPLQWFYRIYGTTGWAAGNTLEEATLQALCEIIERHCISKVIEERLEVANIEIDSIENPLVKDIIKKISSSGIEIFIKDFSLDLEIPTVGVIAYDPLAPTPTLKVYGAAGTHPNPNVALIRALTELIQHRAQVLYRELILNKSGGPTYCFLKFKNLEDAKFLIKGEKISFGDLPSFSHSDFKIEIEYILDKLFNKGFKIYLIETTHPVLEIPSVIVSVPGARLNRPSTKLHPYLLIARQLMDIGKYEDAFFYIEETFKEAPSYKRLPQILSQAAMCAKMIKDYKKSLMYYKSLIEIYPKILQSKKFVNDFLKIMEEVEKV